MNFTDTFIRRPVFAVVLSLIILLVGAKAYFSLSTRLYPKIDASAVTIITGYAGADAELMEGFITTPIENALAGIDGIDYITSQSQMGESKITVHFNLGYDINVAVSDVNAKVSSVRSRLPSGINDPVVTKMDPDARPTMFISFYSDQSSAEEIADYLLRVIQPQIQTLPGVAQAEIWGRTYAMRIWLDPELMAARNVTASDITAALYANNLQAPAGTLKSVSQSINVKTETELDNSKEFNHMVIRESNGSLVRLQDVGRAELGSSTFDIQAFANGKQVAVLAITPGPTANPLDVSAEVKKVLPQITTALPKGTTYNLVWDSSRFIQSSVSEVKKTIIQATLCVVAIVFIFLFSWRILLIPMVTIPLSLIGVCGVMLAMGYSLNTITFLSMVLAIGMVVDDAIVVSENIHRHLASGKTPINAALIGTREIQFAVISMTLTLAAVYAPIGFLSGLIGALFKEFAFTLASAVIISGFIALTLSPMMCSKLMTAHVLHSPGAVRADQLLEKIMHFYKKLLHQVLRYRNFVIGGLVVVFLALYVIYRIIPSELAPREDVGGVYIITTSPTSANLEYTEQYTKKVESILSQVPEKENYLTVNYPNNAFSVLILQDWSKRKRSSQEIVSQLFPQLWSIPGVLSIPVITSMLPGSSGAMPVEFIVQTLGDYNDLNNVMQQLKAAAYTNPGFANIDIKPKLDQVQVNLKINRDKAGDLGVPVRGIGDAINIALGEPTTTRFSILGHSYDVIPQLESHFRNRPDALNKIYVRSDKDQLIPLANLLTLKEIVQPQALDHFQQMRAATLSATLKPNYTLGQALDYLQEVSKKIVPHHMQISYSGESRRYMQTMGTMGTTFVFALIFIFLILAAQFESFRDPLIVLFSVPLSIFGALLALWLTGGTMNIYSEIGLVTLIGLISKHGILMVEFANQLQKQGKSIKEAIVEAASIRLRPILMTTSAMILGALPLAMATGAGAISRREIGIVIIGGMLIGTTFTLFVVPTIYTYLATKKKVD